MKHLIFVLLCCCFAVALSLPTRKSSNNVRTHRNTEGPEDPINRQVMVWLSKHRTQIAGVIQKIPTITQESKNKLIEALHKHPTADFECNGCVIFVDLVRLVINLGLDYEDIEGISIQVCEILLEFEGYRGDIICPGVVPNYGPHLFTIFEESQNTSSEICEVLEYCDPVQEANTETNNQKHKSQVPFSERKAKIKHTSRSSKLRARQPFHGLKEHTAVRTVDKVIRRISDQKGKIREKRQTNQLKIAQITDVHVEFDYVPGSATVCGLHMCCRNETNGTGSAPPWGAWTCNIPPSTVEMFLDYIAELQPDAILYTGDTPSNAVWAETNVRQINSTIWLGQKIADYLPDVPAFFTIGNHETFPTNLYYAPRPEMQMLHQALNEYWGPLAEFGQEQIDSMNDGGYYTTLLRPGLRILSWNSNLGASSNWYNILNHYRPEYYNMQDFVTTTLSQARENSEKVIALSHHPVGGGLRYYTEWETQVVVEYGDVILLHAQGHSHSDFFNVFVDPVTGEPRTYQLLAPSMSTSPEKNPSCRLFYVDADTFELSNFEQYIFYLGNEDGLVENPEISFWYSATEDYGMANLTAAGWLDFVYRMSEDVELFNTYYLNEGTLQDVEVDCTGDCIIDELCDRINTVEGQSFDCPLRV